MNVSANHPNCREALRDLMGDVLRGDAEAIDEVIVRVLRRVRQAAEELDTPNDARVILQVAHSFADELTSANPQFDRVGFIRSATEGAT